MEKIEIIESINKISKEIEDADVVLDLLYERAGLYTKIQESANAMNDYLAILEEDVSYKDAQVRLDMLKTIAKFVNIDIYASPNTNMDPWMD